MLMVDSDMTDAWIERAVKDNPITLLDNGNYRTCPVRLSFPNILEKSKPKRADIEPSYGANLLFPLCADLSVLEGAVAGVLKEKCPDALSTDPKKKVKVKLPFLKQAEMARYDGYHTEDGAKYLVAVSKQNKPVCVDLKGQIVTDPARVYAGVWAFATIRPFWYDVGVNKGVSFGLQSVMIVVDDRNLGGGSEDVSKAFAGINISAGDVDTSGLFD